VNVRVRHLVLASGLIVSVRTGAFGRATAADSAAPVRLVRCAAGRDLPCLTTRVVLRGRAAESVARLDSAAESHGWTGVLGGARLIGPAIAVPRHIEPPLRLLILLDRSGSMIGEGIAFTRLTLRSFIEGLDSATTRVAVAGFESRDVNGGIDAARFLPPREAARALDSLPVPDRQANTALYSALVHGVAHVASARRAAPGTQGAILLVTDGRNDVGHPRDDAGLLAGETGLRAAAAAAAESGSRIWIMGVGDNLSASEIETLAGSRGAATTVSLDPNAMAARLNAIARELRGFRDLTFGVGGGAAAALARAPWMGTAAVWDAGKPVLTQTLSWRPPLFALPAYEGVAAAASLPAELADVATAGIPASGMRWLMALFFGLVGAVLWLVAPRYAWARLPTAGIVVAEPPAPRAKPASADTTGLRRDVTEAPPRKPGDVTREMPAVSAASTPPRPARGS